MQNKHLLWLGSLVTVGIIATSPSVVAQTNQSDVSGGQTFSAPSIGIDGINGNGFYNAIQFDPSTSTFYGGALGNPISFESMTVSPGGSNSMGTGESSSPNGSSTIGAVDCSGKDCIGKGKPQKVSLDDIAEAIGENLEQSLDTLAAIENESAIADAGPRRIVRRSSLNDTQACGCDPTEPRRISRNPEVKKIGACCNNPDFNNRELEARRIVKDQLEEAKKFIEQVEQIQPEKYIW